MGMLLAQGDSLQDPSSIFYFQQVEVCFRVNHDKCSVDDCLPMSSHGVTEACPLVDMCTHEISIELSFRCLQKLPIAHSFVI